MWQPAVIGDVPLWIGENVSACGHHESWKSLFQLLCWFEGLWLWIALPVVGVTCGWLREQ
jgi:hypothetical protein